VHPPDRDCQAAGDLAAGQAICASDPAAPTQHLPFQPPQHPEPPAQPCRLDAGQHLFLDISVEIGDCLGELQRRPLIDELVHCFLEGRDRQLNIELVEGRTAGCRSPTERSGRRLLAVLAPAGSSLPRSLGGVQSALPAPFRR